MDSSHCGQWQRALDDEIDAETLSQSSRSWFVQNRALAIAATLMVFIALLVIGGQLTEESSGVFVESVTARNVQPSEPFISIPAPASFVRGIATHFESAQIQLVSMDMNNAVERDEII